MVAALVGDSVATGVAVGVGVVVAVLVAGSVTTGVAVGVGVVLAEPK